MTAGDLRIESIMSEEFPPTPASSRKKLGPKKWLLLVLVALGLGVLVYKLIPEGTLDLSKEEEPFRSMVLPLKEVNGKYGTNESSILVRFTDSKDHEFKIWFRTDGTLGNRYPNAVQIGDPKVDNGIILGDAARARAITVRLLKEHGDLGGQNAGALEILSSNLYIRRIKNLFR